MGISNFLVSITSFGEGFGSASVSHEWIVNIIKWIVEFAGDVGLGIILFTLALKLITLPLDIFSRASMKKNSLKMEMMKEDLEKLQKQYANNQQLYQQKMMALYKKNGYSAFSACLPTIITLVFFIIVLNGFNSYSRLTEKEVFNDMGKAYSLSVEDRAQEGILVFSSEDGGLKTYLLNIDKALEDENLSGYFDKISASSVTDENNYIINDIAAFSAGINLESYYLAEYFDENGYNYGNIELAENVNIQVNSKLISLLNDDLRVALVNAGAIDEANGIIRNLNEFYLSAGENVKKYFYENEGNYFIDYKTFLLSEENASIKAEFDSEAIKTVSLRAIEKIGYNYLEQKVKIPAGYSAKAAYESSDCHSAIIPWVKNLWVVDSPFSSALKDYSSLKTSLGNNIGSLSESAYKEITRYLKSETETGFGKGNGYFILVALSIAAMLCSTLVMNKTQKTQTQLSSVEGANSTAASTQKMMTWIMPIMFGVFAFIYSASFSLYMITSTLISMLFTLAINFFVEQSFRKKLEKEAAEKAAKQKYGKRR